MVSPRVLLAHENSDCRKIYGSVLEHGGYEVSVSEDCDVALAQLIGGRFDLVITDLYLRSTEDECFLRRLRSRGTWPHLPVVVLTGWTTEPHRRLAMEEGADAFYPLPMSPRELVSVANKLLSRRPSPTLSRSAPRSDARDRPISPAL
jgi:DNA-binding response OmpR family regulator